MCSNRTFLQTQIFFTAHLELFVLLKKKRQLNKFKTEMVLKSHCLLNIKFTAVYFQEQVMMRTFLIVQ